MRAELHVKTVLITGKGRSGTTWLAQILNTYLHCVYKHEPFLPSKHNGYSKLRAELGEVSAPSLRARYEQLVAKAVYDVDQPPFLAHKSVRTHNEKLTHALYGLGTRVSRLRFLFELYARPHLHEDADILIKDVNFPNELLGKLTEVIEPYLVPIVRNPFANIASHLKGVEIGQFAAVRDADRARVRELLQGCGDPSLEQYVERLPELSPLQFEAVRWRLQVEPLVAFSKSYGRSKLVVYEDLCEDPMKITEGLFEFAGWRLRDVTREFIERSTSGAKKSGNEGSAYYSVYRDPRKSMNKWRDQLDASAQADIESVFRDSPVRDLWPNLV